MTEDPLRHAVRDRYRRLIKLMKDQGLEPHERDRALYLLTQGTPTPWTPTKNCLKTNTHPHP